ncbi:MAG: FKBP-type peptidyl-prolyl cis-trans isomerase [Acidobacteriota bacterium]|nr:FKBP-type peptidyl-prolyl cis-trans isomerase [Acidobacteriota bacterium]
MTLKLAFLTVLACAVAAPAQTTHRTVSAPHRIGATAAMAPPNIPKVAGMAKPLYALRYIDIAAGTGPLAEQRKYYTVRYTGWLANGSKFDSSYDHPGGDPITFPYGAHQVITGWDTGFQGMHVGGKRRLFVPYQLAYGGIGRPPLIPAKSDLIFDIELVAQSDTLPQANPAASPAPKPAEAAPAVEGKPSTPSPPATPPAQTPSTPSPQPNAPSHPE